MRLFALFALVSLASAQQAPEAPKKARIEGNVVSSTGQPIPRAQIRLQGQIQIQAGQISQPAVYTATSDDAGNFSIDEIDPGRLFQLTAQRPGFVTARYGARSANSQIVPLSLEAGVVMKGLSLTMTPQGVVSGRITDSNGDPVQNVQVVLLRRGYNRGVRQLLQSSSATTNDQGDYRISNLAPGRYFLMAQDRQVNITTGGPTAAEGPIATYYPNGADPQSAAPIDIAAGQELRGLDFRMRRGRVYSIRGKLAGSSAAPGAPMLILTTPKSTTGLGLLNRQAQARPDGTFELRGLAPGTYILQSLAPQPPTRASGRVEVTVRDSDVNDVLLTTSPGSTVTGSIRVEDDDIKKLLPSADTTTPLTAAAALAGLPIAGGARMSVALTDTVPNQLTGTQPAVLKDDGSFTLEGIPPSRLQVTVLGLPQGYYVKSATLGGTDVTREAMDLTSGAGGNLNILLSSKAADVSGSIRSEKNEALIGVMVTLWTRDPEPGNTANGVRTVATDQSGGFNFQGLRPGVYYAAAWEEIDTGLAQARDFLTLLTTEATKIELAEGAHSAIEVKLIPTAKIKAAEEKLP